MKHQLVENNDLKQVYSAKNYGITKVQTVLNLFTKNSLKELIPYCNENQITVYGRMPLAKGLLSGKYHDKNSLPKVFLALAKASTDSSFDLAISNCNNRALSHTDLAVLALSFSSLNKANNKSQSKAKKDSAAVLKS